MLCFDKETSGLDKLRKHHHADITASASAVNLGSVAGCLLGGYLGGRCGPRRTIQLSCAVAGLGWAAIAAAPHTASLIIGRTGPASGVRDARQILILILTLVTKDPLKDPFNKVYLAAL